MAVPRQRQRPHSNQAQPKPPKNTSSQKLQEDDRIFVHAHPDHTRLAMSPYAVMLQLIMFLKEKLVRKVQKMRSGFAICPASAPAHETLLSRMSEIQAFLSTEGECKVEKPVQHSAFKLSRVPCSFMGYDGTKVVLNETTATIIASALTDLTNVTPANILECKGETYNQFTHQKNWIALFSEGSHLSKSLPLFGVRVATKLLPKRMKTP